ncbi:NAD synthetase [Patulibacter medicamentivorans]|uniref:Glutamine-dependent NAD(+) synthetase n=1 Tax=Patulibacter medicamentivorans TaxID=1097667 RepID=H0EBF7_9ACTN|nr:NAD+ synthase [Patulibacter medicamentivorans]EHN09033.1 NAD synthetase [Patulibacter medicamentivorans]
MRIALAQIDLVVGDLSGNARRSIDAIEAAREAGAAITVLPELTITGYPPEDLLFKQHFLDDARVALDDVAAATSGTVAIVGFPERGGDAVYNAAAILADGEVQGIVRKVRLPNYGVFDEYRYFGAGDHAAIVEVDGVPVAVTICEDLWLPDGPAAAAAAAGATVILNTSASPYHRGKGHQRERMLAQRARDHVAVVALCNQVGGQDELVFDGHSVILDHEGLVVGRAAQFAEDLLVCDVDPAAASAARLRDPRGRLAHRPALGTPVRTVARLTTAATEHPPTSTPPRHGHPQDESPHGDGELFPTLDPIAEVYAALVLATRDYVAKNGFSTVVLGLSGGIDSTLVLLVAIDALGADRVRAIVMPSPYSSEGTQSDADRLADAVGVQRMRLGIKPAMDAYDQILAEPFSGLEMDLTEENLQARIRGNLLMALSNKHGWLVLTTGNKSEMSVGYSTLYGDSAGGFAVIKDCPKTLVYDLVAHRRQVTPDAWGTDGEHDVLASIVERPPSAELRHDQRDDQSLPPYDVLDRILEGYVELDLGRDQLVDRGLPAADVERVIRLVDLAEYKRRQSPPGVKITPRALGRDRRLPITNRYGG